LKTLDFLNDISIYQHIDGYRVSVDALLLYSFVRLKRIDYLADLGAGCGVIGLLLAKKYGKARVLLIELQEGLARLAADNIRLNRLEERVSLIHGNIIEVSGRPEMAGAFDAVVSNPPFRQLKTGLMSPKDERAIARHEGTLTLSQLLRSASLMLKHHGRLYMIHLPERLPEIVLKMRQNSIEIKVLRFVHSYAHSNAKMILIEAVKGAKPGGVKVINPLIIYCAPNTYSQEVLDLYKTG
jgi:tRNA1Val (adenine37-N6)-methyltransferase